jgi:hypothetical protein
MLVINAVVYAAILFSSLLQEPYQAEWNKKSTLTTDQQVEFPGIVLEPGVYTVRLLQSGEKRSRVQILNQDETQVLATLLAVPDHRVRPEDNSEFTYYEMKNKTPLTVQSWFYSGDYIGLEFVYPKVRAKEIAKQSDGHVMASNGNKEDAIVAITPNGMEVVIDDPAPAQSARRKPQSR